MIALGRRGALCQESSCFVVSVAGRDELWLQTDRGGWGAE